VSTDDKYAGGYPITGEAEWRLLCQMHPHKAAALNLPRFLAYVRSIQPTLTEGQALDILNRLPKNARWPEPRGYLPKKFRITHTGS
jgi:hypothetical protein